MIMIINHIIIWYLFVHEYKLSTVPIDHVVHLDTLIPKPSFASILAPPARSDRVWTHVTGGGQHAPWTHANVKAWTEGGRHRGGFTRRHRGVGSVTSVRSGLPSGVWVRWGWLGRDESVLSWDCVRLDVGDG